MVNKVILVGNIGRDAELRRLENGTAVATTAIATNEVYRDKENNWQTITDWHNLVLWRNLAERAENQLKKGRKVYLEGKLKSRKYTDQSGTERYITEVVVDTFYMLDKQDQPGAPASGYAPQEASRSNSNFDMAPSVDDDLPF